MNIYQIALGEVRLPVERGGGADNIIFCVSKYLAKKGHNVTCVERKHLPIDPSVEYIDDLKIVRLKSKKFGLGLFSKIAFLSHIFLFFASAINQTLFAYQVRKYLSKINDSNMDIVHIHSSTFILPLTLINKKLRSKLFYTSHTPRRLLDSPKVLDRLALGLENRFLKRMRKVIVLNQLVKKKVSRAAKLKEDDIAILPVGIDPLDFTVEINTEEIEEKYGLKDKILLLFVGRIIEEKGIHCLIKATDILVHKWDYKNIQLLLVGPVGEFGLKGLVQTPYFKKVLSLIKDCQLKKNINLTGLVSKEELKGLYSACYIFILPSISEATPTVVLEAMSSGKPVIATRVGGIPEQVEDGKSGFLIEPRNENQLAGRIRYLIENPKRAKEMGLYGRRVVEERFGWDRVVDRLLDIYEKGKINVTN